MHVFHDITKRYSDIKIDINGKIYELEIEGYPRKGNLYEIEGFEIMLEGDIDEDASQIKNPREIWIKLK